MVYRYVDSQIAYEMLGHSTPAQQQIRQADRVFMINPPIS
jgi:hypothetical protein